MKPRSLIDISLGHLWEVLGPPPPPLDIRIFVEDMLDGKFAFLCEQIGDAIFGHNKILCLVEQASTGGRRDCGVWCSHFLSPPKLEDVPKTTVIFRPFYVRAMPREQIIFDVALELAILRLRCLYGKTQKEERTLAHLLTMYCGFAEVCVEECLYVNLKMRCGSGNIEFVGSEMPLSPEDISYTLRLIQHMRVPH